MTGEGAPVHLPEVIVKATLRRRTVTPMPYTLYVVRVLFGSMMIDATAFPAGEARTVGVIQAGVVGGRLRIRVPAGVDVHARVDHGPSGRFWSEVGDDRGQAAILLSGAVVLGSIVVEQWDA